MVLLEQALANITALAMEAMMMIALQAAMCHTTYLMNMWHMQLNIQSIHEHYLFETSYMQMFL